jgi:hypothetical protein
MFQLWSIVLDPTPDRNVIHIQIALVHELFEVSVTE